MSRITKTVLLGALAVAAIATGCASNAARGEDQGAGVKTLLVATGASPKPYTYLDEKDQLTGYDIEILKLIDERLDDIAFKFEIAEFPALFAGLDSGRFDIVANNLSATEERRKKYDFSEPTSRRSSASRPAPRAASARWRGSRIWRASAPTAHRA